MNGPTATLSVASLSLFVGSNVLPRVCFRFEPSILFVLCVLNYSLKDLNDWSTTVDWKKLSEDIIDSISSSVLTDIRSGVVCSFNAKANILKTVRCACLSNEDDIASCFTQQDTVQTGTGEACIALQSTIQTATGSLEFDGDNIDPNSKQRCAEITVYSSSIYTLEQPEQVAFSPLSRVRNYDSFNVVLNDDDAIVGRVMSDGFEVQYSGATILHYHLCIRQNPSSGDAPSSFDVWDFAERKGDFLTPLEVKLEREPNEDGSSFHHMKCLLYHLIDFYLSFPLVYCGAIEDPANNKEYFLIKRMDNYKDQSGSLYSDGETGCWWFFAAAFTVLAIWALMMIAAHYLDNGFALHYYVSFFSSSPQGQRLTTPTKFRIAMLAFSVMAVTRGLYFYLLAARVLEDKSDSGGS